MGLSKPQKMQMYRNRSAVAIPVEVLQKCRTKHNNKLQQSSRTICNSHLPPTISLEHIRFNNVLKSRTRNQEDHPVLLKQMTLNIMNVIPPEVLTIYSDDSSLGKAESGVFNSKCEEVLKSEIIAIAKAMNYAIKTLNVTFGY
ncbi:hypothetical protein TNCT_268481 [Trichonephila clavata]|uniref:Uncharacterized protein n=1 Tax=Trichonephila clavata TaxID=2740835 RepID=A0A8X6FWR4_TRICU|nr:hypothetical protein TNCT_268481 [Trichonephila clavata]